MMMLISALVLVTSSIVAGQRGSFAGIRPIGFPDTPNRTTTTPDPLGNRFGEGIPQRLPIEANGDWDLVDRLSKLPIDKQPFWFINWQSYEKHRKDPQTYPQRPNAFVDPIPIKINSSQGNNGLSTPTPGFIGTEPTVVINRFGPTTGPSSGNFNNNAYPSSNVFPNVNSNSNVYPSGNNNSNPTPNVNPISNVYPIGNPISNVYPTGNPISNVYPTGNPNSNVYPAGNPISNVYPTANPISNVFPAGNPISNVYPAGNPISNVYPTGNPISNVYPAGNPISNIYPTGNPISNVYPIGNSNSNVYQTSNINSNYRTVTKNGATYQTTQKQWESYFMASNVGTTSLNKYPAYYPRTDTYPSF